MVPIRFLSVDDVLAIHEDTMNREGGLAGLRDPGLLVSAVTMPQQQFGGQYLHEDLAAMAAAYLFHIAQNRPFLDGNKQVAAMAALVFLDANSVTKLPPPDELEKATLDLAAGKMDKETLTGWMRQHID